MSTLVLGAGSSIGADPKIFKSGIGLVEDILELVTTGTHFYNRISADYSIPFETINSFNKHLKEYAEMNRNINKNYSIDEFRFMIHNFPEYNKFKNDYDWISKTAILYCILKWENSFKTGIENGAIDYKKLWIQNLIPYLIERKGV